MHYIIAVFKSRNETLYLANMFKTNALPVSIINTPKEAGATCGISVKFDEKFLPLARSFLVSKPFHSFYGFFRIKFTNGYRQSIERI